MPTVRMTNEEMEIFGAMAQIRWDRCADRGAKNSASGGTPTMDDEFEGLAAEFAVAKLLDRYPSSIGGLGCPDVSKDIEVRWAREDWGGLFFYGPPKDDPQHRYVLVTGRNGIYEVRGWSWGFQCQQDKYWKTENLQNPAWLKPQRDLDHNWGELRS